MPLDRSWLRSAMKLEHAWCRRRTTDHDDDYLWDAAGRDWNHLLSLRQRIRAVGERQWTEARVSLECDLRWRIDELTRRLHDLRELPPRPVQPPTLRDWLDELQALDDEFGNLEFTERLTVVRVTTEPVTLKDVELGPFAIELHLDRISHQRGSACFTIVALRPNPAKDRDEVTHPHVNDGDLCAGDAVKPIERALLAGRLSEAFLLVRSVLQTYNPGSPYVPLDLWDGEACTDCGGRMSGERSSYCEGCHRDYCDGCISMCRACEESRCTGCLEPCADCEEHCCHRCLEVIARQRYCPDCRGICDGCDAATPTVKLDDNNFCSDCRSAETDLVPEPSTLEPEVTHAT